MEAREDTREVLDIAGVASLLQCSESHIRALVAEGVFPRPSRIGALCRWRRGLVLDWLDQNRGRRVVVRGGKTAQTRG